MFKKRTLWLFVAEFFVLWTGAWIAHQVLVYNFSFWQSSQQGIELAYWASMKALVWVVYPYFFWKRNVPSIRDFIGLSKSAARRGYQWGSVATLVWICFSFLSIVFHHQQITSIGNWPNYIYIALLTPIMEEVMFRGFILSSLLALKVEGKVTNLITTILFLLVHMLGWSFQGVLWANLSSTLWLSIVLVSLVAGFIRIHSGSLRSSILLHIGNNTFSGLFG